MIRIVHVLADGTTLTDITGHVVKAKKENEDFYKACYKHRRLLTNEKETNYQNT